MKRLLLVAAVATVLSQDAQGMANTTRLQCPAGYRSVLVNGVSKCQRQVGPGGTQTALPAHANAQLVRPAMNTRGGIQKQNIGGNSATWAPAMNTSGGIQKQQLIGGNSGTQSLMSRQAAMRRSCTQKGLTYKAVPKQVGYCIMNTQGGVRRMTGNKAGGSY